MRRISTQLRVHIPFAMRIACACASAFAIPSRSLALPADPSLSTIVKTGLEKSLSVQSQRMTLEKARMRHKDSYAALLPTVSLSAGRTWSRTESEVEDNVVAAEESRSNSLRFAGTWTLWDHGSSWRKVKTSATESAAETLRTEFNSQALAASIIDAYLEHLLLVRQEDLKRRYLEQSRRTKEESDILVTAGAKTKIEAVDSEIAVLDAERDLSEAQSALRSSARSLRAALNLPAEEELPALNILELKPYFLARFENSFSAIEKLSAQERVAGSFEDRISKLGLENSLSDYRQAQWDYWPRITLDLNHYWSYDQVINENREPRGPMLQSTSLGLNLTWSIFDWFTSTRALKSAEYDFQIRSNSYVDEHRRAVAEQENLREQYLNLKMSIESSRLTLEKARRQLENSRELYRYGRINLLLMQQATNRYFEAENNYASRVKTQYTVMAQILLKSGNSILPEN